MPDNIIPILGPSKEQPANLYKTIAPSTLGALLSPSEDVDSVYQSYYRDYTQQASITPVPRVYGYEPYTTVTNRIYPVGPAAVFEAGLATGLTGKIYDMASSSLTAFQGGESGNIINVAQYMRDNEDKLKSSEAGRYIWYNRYLSGAYDDITQLGPLVTAMANDEVNFRHFKVIGQSSTAAETAALYGSYFADPTTIVSSLVGGAGAARAGLSGLAATEAVALAQGVTREAILHMSEPAHNYGDTIAGLSIDVALGAALYGAGKFVAGRFAAKGVTPPKPFAGEPTEFTFGRIRTAQTAVSDSYVDAVNSRLVRSPDVDPSLRTTTAEWNARYNEFTKENPELSRSRIIFLGSNNSPVGSRGNPLSVGEYYATRYNVLLEQEVQNVLSGKLPETSVQNLDAKINNLVLRELGDMRWNIKLPDENLMLSVNESSVTPSAGSKVRYNGQDATVLEVIDTPDGAVARISSQAETVPLSSLEAEFVKARLSTIPRPRFVIDAEGNVAGAGNFSGQSIDDMVKSGTIGEAQAAEARLYSSYLKAYNEGIATKTVPEANPNGLADEVKTAAQEAVSELLKSRNLSQTNLIKKPLEGFLRYIYRKAGFMESETGLAGFIREYGVPPTEQQAMRRAVETGAAYFSDEQIAKGSTAKPKMLDPETARDRFANWTADWIVDGAKIAVSAAGIYALSRESPLETIKNWFSGVKDFNSSSDYSRSLVDPEMFRAMQLALNELPDSKAKLSLLRDVREQMSKGLTSPEYVSSFNENVMSLIRDETLKVLTDVLGISAMTDDILDNASIAYSSLYNELSNYQTQLSSLSDAEKNEVRSALQTSYNLLRRAEVRDPALAAKLYGSSVYSFSQSETFAKSYVHVIAAFRNQKEGNMNGLNGIGSDKASLLNISVVRAIYEDMLDGGTSLREALETPYMTGVANSWLLERLEKSTGEDIETPVYAPQDGPTLLSFYALQNDLKRKEGAYGDLEKESIVNTLPVAPQLLIRKIRDKMAEVRPKVQSYDYQQFDIVRRRTAVQKDTMRLLEETKPQKQNTVLQEKR